MLLPALKSIVVATALLASTPAAFARSWTNADGKKIEADYVSSDAATVVLKMNGKDVRYPLAKLSPADREFVAEQAKASPAAAPTEAPAELAQPPGKVVGPIEAEGSHYHLYLPRSLRAGQKAPLLFFTNSGGGSEDRMKPMLEGAEICGWVVAMSVESKNGMEKEDSVVHCKRCVEHLLETLPIDPKRVYFSGTSGGAREAFYNSSQMESAGVLALIAGAAPGELSRSKHYFFISGATDYNRYGTAKSFDEVKSSAAFRFHPGTHEDGPADLMTEGMVWLEAKARQKGKAAAGGAGFELAAIAWAEGLKTTEPHRAAWWADCLAQSRPGPAVQARAETLKRELANKPDSVAYAKGLADLQDFACDVLAEGPLHSPECFEHTSPEIQKKADQLLEDHAATPGVKEILEALKNKTGKG